MKPLLLTAGVLLALSQTMPVYAQEAQEPPATPAQEEQTLLKAEIDTPYYHDNIIKDTPICIDFDTPMVPEESLESAPTEGYVKVYYRDDNTPIAYTAEWLSASKLELVISDEVEPMRMAVVRVCENVKNLEGRRYEETEMVRYTSEGVDVAYTGSHMSPRVVFFGGSTEFASEQLEKRLHTMYFLHNEQQIPAKVRQATAGDAVEHWDAYEDAFRYVMNDSDSADMAKLPADTLLPHTWVCEIPFYSTEEKELMLILPAAEQAYRYGGYEDKVLYRSCESKPRIMLSNTAEGMGKNTIELWFTIPAKADDIPGLLRKLQWSVHDYKHNRKSTPLHWQDDNTLRTTIRGQEIVISWAADETQEYVESFKLSDGSTVQGVHKITLHADLGGENAPSLLLNCRGYYDTVNGKVAEKELEDYTNLTPRDPFIYSDVNMGHMMSGGTTTINCEYGRISNGRVRICKFAEDAESVVRAINAYQTCYTDYYHNHMPYEQTAFILQSPSHRVNKMRAVPIDFLAGIEQEVTLPLDGSHGSEGINFTEPFGNADKNGLYFVEISGQSLCRDDHGAPVVNQGLIQVTNLGLTWKLNGKRIFAWGYHLSDGKEVAEGTLRLLDKTGKILAEIPLHRGVAEGVFPAETKFLQLSTADDSVVICHNPDNNDSDAAESWKSERLAGLGVPADELPQALIYTFSDRSIYRPGEEAHIKGMVRWVINNELLTPEIESINATVHHRYGKKTYSVTPAADGSFCLDLTTECVGTHHVEFTVTYKGDNNGTSPDYAAFARHNVATDGWYTQNVLFEESRRGDIYLTVEEFRRNEFEVESKAEADWQEGYVEIDTKATNFTTTPVANGEVEWYVSYERHNFYPRDWKDYRFGDFSESAWAHFYAYYMDDESAGCEHITGDSSTGQLDANGEGLCTFDIPENEQFNRGRIAITASSMVTNGNGQSITSTRELRIDPCEAYAGIKTEQRLMKVGQKMPVSLVAVCPDGNAWQGAPLQGKIKVVRTSHTSYRYGAAAASGIHNVKDEEVVWDAPVSFSGTPCTVEIPLERAGIYTIEAGFTDTQGHVNTSLVKHYVWGDDESPWYYEHGTELNMVPDKDMYKAGDTANILVQTPVDAEVLVTVERGKVLRHYKRTITVNNPVLQVPIEAGDAPVVYVGVSIVQSGENRKKDGTPLLKMGVCPLNIETPEKVLSIELDAPEQHLLPTDTCVVSGIVRDAAGNPVANADVTLYAEDEGTLQVLGYSLPKPQLFFYSEKGRPQGLNTYSALGQLYGDNLRYRDMGNKGIFVGGGAGGASRSAVSDDEADYLRENFCPCALWVGSIKTDAEGRFRVSYVNPDTLTRYRLMAVAAERDRFGSARTVYHVTKPIMLEPVAPMGATEGDMLHMPVTISMLPEQLAEAANGAAVEWTVSISGSNVTLPEPVKTVSLKGNEPVTITFPIKTEHAGKVVLQWHVQAANPGSSERLAACKDAVKLEFEVIPPTPFLRERTFRTLTGAQTVPAQQFFGTVYRADSPVELTFSTTPLTGLRYYIQYLLTYPYGCSEQLSSAVIPWILKPELEEALGITLPTEKDRDQVLAETFERLHKRHRGDAYYSYWDTSDTPSEYSPYVVLVKQLALEHEVNAPGIASHILSYQYRALETLALPADKPETAQLGGMLADHQNKSTVAPKLLNLYVLARAGKLQPQLLDQCIERVRNLKQATPEQRWMLALCARMCNHPEADTLKQEAEAEEVAQQQAKELFLFYSSDILPPLAIIRLLYTIEDAPNAPETAEAIRRFMDAGSFTYSTWRNAWTTIALYEYMKKSDVESKSAVVNGHTINSKQPLTQTMPYGAATDYSVQGDTVYVTGYAEGHTADAQPVQAINQGFKVTRRFEKLMPDGSWQPTATFAVGDVVKVYLTVEADESVPAYYLRYQVVEDRLPAAFEAINPALVSQALPPGVTEQETADWWYWSSHIDNREYLKDRVRFFSSYVNYRKTEATYVARVLRRGEVTAPATKAELMYRPEVRGLSIPQKLQIK